MRLVCGRRGRTCDGLALRALESHRTSRRRLISIGKCGNFDIADPKIKHIFIWLDSHVE